MRSSYTFYHSASDVPFITLLEAKNWLYWLKEVGKSELLGVKFSVCFPVKGLVLQEETTNKIPIKSIFFIFYYLITSANVHLFFELEVFHRKN